MKIIHYNTLPSTNQTALEAAENGCEAFLCVLADAQSAGRGRGDHRFFSPRDGLYFSTVLRPTLPVEEYGRITPFAAVAVFRAVVEVCHVYPRIKWVNDLLYNERKVCGILAQSGTDRFGHSFVVLGIGINTGNAPFPPELSDIAGTLPCPDKNALLYAILGHLKHFEAELQSGAWLREFRENLAFVGETVLFSDGVTIREATCLGIADSGAIRLLLPSGEIREFSFGEISVRPAQKR